MNAEHREKLIQYAKRLLGASAPGRGRESMAALSGQDEEIVDRVAMERTIGEADTSRLEAIILPGLRPVFDILNDSYEELPAPWGAMNEAAARERLQRAIAAIGRVEIPGHPRLAYGGTGFLAGPNLLLTNRHVAAIFADGVGVRQLTMTFPARVDLAQETGSERTVPLTVTKASLIHPHWDAALLTVTGVPRDIAPLTLAADAPGGSRMVAVVGYPAFDPRNNVQVQREVFRDLFEKKRLQPGYAAGAGVVTSFGHAVEAATHDASTLGGNSGSAVIDVATGYVIGLHFAGVYLETNYAVPAWELARDPRVVDLGVRFAKSASATVAGRPAWLGAWRTLEEPAAVAAPVAARAEEYTWTIPIQVTIRVGAPAPAPAPAAPAPGAPADDVDPLAQLREARRRLTEDPGSYYPEALDRAAAETYYAGVQPNSAGFAGDLTRLLTDTHVRALPYKPTVHLYPLVDLQPDGDLISIYSERPMDPQELIRIETPLEEAMEAMLAAGADVEAIPSNSAEHVVPQSWFGARQPMRGDLHHLFACDRNCNSFRSNTAYWEFGPEERVMEDCGRSERTTDQFEPKGGKGAVARATLYFLLRYAGQINVAADRAAVLLRWHRENPATRYERHRNREIFLKQGNRNPFIDHPEWAEAIEFGR